MGVLNWGRVLTILKLKKSPNPEIKEILKFLGFILKKWLRKFQRNQKWKKLFVSSYSHLLFIFSLFKLSIFDLIISLKKVKLLKKWNISLVSSINGKKYIFLMKVNNFTSKYYPYIIIIKNIIIIALNFLCIIYELSWKETLWSYLIILRWNFMIVAIKH